MERITNVERKLDEHIKEQSFYEEKTADILKVHGKDLKEIKASLNAMKPSYRMIRNFETTGEVLGKTGKALFSIIVVISAIIGAIYALKDWIKR